MLTLERPLQINGAFYTSLTGDAIAALAELLPSANDEASSMAAERTAIERLGRVKAR